LPTVSASGREKSPAEGGQPESMATKRSSLVSLGTNEAEIFWQARRFRVALTWALEIVIYGRSGMLVGCVGTGELKLQGSEKRRFRETDLFRYLAPDRKSLLSNISKDNLFKNLLVKLTALRRV
jgi:hypothetical protein